MHCTLKRCLKMKKKKCLGYPVSFVKVSATQWYPSLCHHMDFSPPGSSVHVIVQAIIWEWVAISFPEDLPNPGVEPRSPALQADSLSSEPPRVLE